MPKTPQHGTGLLHRPFPHPQIFGAEYAATVPDFTKSTNLPEPPDEDQGSSNSCTSQAFGYRFWASTSWQLLRNDTYSHTFLPGGGAYLDAPAIFVNQFGAYFRGVLQDPNPETEPNMEQVVVTTNDSTRIKAVHISITPLQADINVIGNLLEQYKGIIIGLDGNDEGWADMEDPTYNGQAEWGHALYVYDRAVISTQPALKAKSSWCNEVKNHFINKAYFDAGGVFEALGFTVQETDMQFFQVTGESTIVALINGQYRELATDPALFPYCKQALGIPDQLSAVDRPTVNASLGKQIVAGITL